jgi:transposase
MGLGLPMARRTKRLWTVEEKRSICLQTTAPGVSVAQVARRYALNANVIFKWLRDPRFVPDPDTAPAEGPCFLPVEVINHPVREDAPASGDARHPGGTIEIDVAGGHRMRISGRYDPEALARLIRGLSG